MAWVVPVLIKVVTSFAGCRHRRTGPDLTPTAGNIEDAGYVDVWAALHLPPEYGLTWPRYLEDIAPMPTSQVLATPTERIDLIFEKGLTPLNIERTLSADLPPIEGNHCRHGAGRG